MNDNIPASVWEKKDRRITRMSCIKSAVDLVTGAKAKDATLVILPAQVISVAQEFEKYVYGE